MEWTIDDALETQIEVMPIHPEKIPVVRAEIFKACMYSGVPLIAKNSSRKNIYS